MKMEDKIMKKTTKIYQISKNFYLKVLSTIWNIEVGIIDRFLPA